MTALEGVLFVAMVVISIFDLGLAIASYRTTRAELQRVRRMEESQAVRDRTVGSVAPEQHTTYVKPYYQGGYPDEYANNGCFGSNWTTRR